jgi:5'(3')-deoxyribonucleotidase
MQIFLDCDGVLADFDITATNIFGKHPRIFEAEAGSDEFWRRLREHGDFYRNLPLLPDARELFDAVAHLNPIILTGCPEGGWAEEQKVAWAKEHFPGSKIITCASSNKRMHMQPGDVLIDDYLKYKDLWEEAGGIFIHHRTAEESLEQLAALGVEIARPRPI